MSMARYREGILRGDLVQDVRRLLLSGAQDHGGWVRENLGHALLVRGDDAVAVSALTGLAPGTVRGFLKGRPSSIDNVLLIAEALGYTLAELDRPASVFREHVRSGRAGPGATIGTSLLEFDESPTAMAVFLFGGTIVKVNHALLDLLGYEEGELIGASVATLSLTDAAANVEWLDELASTDATHSRVTQLRRKDGSPVAAVTSALVFRNQDGESRYVIARASPVEGDTASVPGATGVGEAFPGTVTTSRA